MKRSASSRSGARGGKKRRATARSEAVTATTLDALHDAGGDLSAHLDLARTRRPGRETQRVNVDFPTDLLEAIDREARRVGVTRQAFIKLRLADSIDQR